MRSVRIYLVMIVFGVLSLGVEVLGQEVGPERIVDAELRVVEIGSEEAPVVIATGTVASPDDCEYCLVHSVQHRIIVPERVVRLVIELANTSDPTGDIDLIVRENEPVTEDESSYFYSYRTYGAEGDERLELPEDGVDVVPAGDYYIGIVSFVEPGATYEVRAIAFVEKVRPETIALESNMAVSEQLQPGQISGDLDWQYVYSVPPGVSLVVVHAESVHADVDLLVGADPIERDEDGRLTADLQLRSTGLDELLVIGSPASGELWIVVGNDSPDPVSYTLAATSLPAIEGIDIGSQIDAAVGSDGGLVPLLLDHLKTSDGMLGLTQYRLDLSAGVETLHVDLEGSDVSDIRLHLRYGEPVEVSGGDVVADLSATEGASKGFTLQDAFVREGTSLYFALERVGEEGEKVFSLRVDADVESGD